MAFHPAACAHEQELFDVGVLGKGTEDIDIGGDDIAL
jgi:hypothetical protein